jgi:Arc/MetJ-type ribon-helix-helix transcriptional regulator
MHKKRVDVQMTNPYLSGMNLLIQDGLYQNQSEIIKDALRRLLRHYEIRLVTETPEAPIQT